MARLDIICAGQEGVGAAGHMWGGSSAASSDNSLRCIIERMGVRSLAIDSDTFTSAKSYNPEVIPS